VSEDSPDVQRARHSAELARAKFWATFEEAVDYAQSLQEKLAPSYLARDAWEAAKSKGVDIAEDAVDAVRKRPVAASGAVAALAVFIAREPLMELAGKLMGGAPKKKSKKAARPKVPVETNDE
jgi:hypothetical protein